MIIMYNAMYLPAQFCTHTLLLLQIRGGGQVPALQAENKLKKKIKMKDKIKKRCKSNIFISLRYYTPIPN